MAESNIITVEQLRERLGYSPDTGVFVWKVSRGSRCVVGAEVGSWDMHGYKTVRLDGRSYKLHRLAWLYVNGEWPTGDVDHINGVRHDNRISNLRPITRGGNLENRRKANPEKPSGLPLGVHESGGGRYCSKISHGNKSISLGTFATAELAYAAYLGAKRAIHKASTI